MSFMSTLSAIPTQPTKCNKFKSPQQLKSMKPMEAAHKQLELLLTRIENDAVKPRQMAVPVTEPASKRQRCKPPAPAKRVRQQMEHPPPVPTVSPLNSARRNETTTTTTMLSVPLTHNPQLLLETISQSDKQEKQQVVNILHSEHNTNHDHYHHDDDGDDDDVNDADDGDPSKDAVHPTLQMLPLALTPGESPYRENFLPGHRVPRERQKKQQQQLQAPKTQLDTSGKIFQSVLPVEDFDDEKPVSDTKLEHHDQPAEIQPESQQMRQLQAMKERAELDRQKQLVIEWRLRHRLTELRQTEQQMTKRVLKKSLQLKQLKKTISERNARRRGIGGGIGGGSYSSGGGGDYGNYGVGVGSSGIVNDNIGLAGIHPGPEVNYKEQEKYISHLANFQPPVISKHFYLHTAPEDHDDQQIVRYVNVGRPQKNYRVVFINTPASTTSKAKIIANIAPVEEKTAIYVLAKKSNALDVSAEVVTQRPVSHKPEVFFIKYKTPAEAAHAQQIIQANYDALGGSSQSTDEGLVPASSVINSLGDNGASGVLSDGSGGVNIIGTGGAPIVDTIVGGANNGGALQFDGSGSSNTQTTVSGGNGLIGGGGSGLIGNNVIQTTYLPAKPIRSVKY
ncbi:GH11915 [Drosophila grimshawi]|uniref:GH11915 n=1 Tax=Drosophila grimshawi TaxID=7222 RepID=B4JL80_DROGR|nr:GH11915 [Drosophila grimshawi]